MSAYDNAVDAVLFKDEDQDGRGRPVGPVYVRKAGETKNYKDSPRKSFDGSFTPEWYRLADAKKIAKSLGLPFFEV